MPTRRSPTKSGRSLPNIRRYRAVVARRGVSRCDRKPQRHHLGDKDRGRNPGKNPRRNRTHGFGWRLLQQVLRQTGLGSPNPDGLFVITPQMGPGLVDTLPVRKFHGVGPATAKKMKRLGIEIGFDLRAQTLGLPAGTFREGGLLLLLGGARRRRAARPRRSGYENPSAPRTRSPPIFSPTKPRVMRFERS
jgi:IMS family HHH motif